MGERRKIKYAVLQKILDALAEGKTPVKFYGSDSCLAGRGSIQRFTGTYYDESYLAQLVPTEPYIPNTFRFGLLDVNDVLFCLRGETKAQLYLKNPAIYVEDTEGGG